MKVLKPTPETFSKLFELSKRYFAETVKRPDLAKLTYERFTYHYAREEWEALLSFASSLNIRSVQLQLKLELLGVTEPDGQVSTPLFTNLCAAICMVCVKAMKRSAAASFN